MPSPNPYLLAFWLCCILTVLSLFYLCIAVPVHSVSVVHTDTLTHPAEPEAQAEGQEGDQGGVPEKHTVRRTARTAH